MCERNLWIDKALPGKKVGRQKLCLSLLGIQTHRRQLDDLM